VSIVLVLIYSCKYDNRLEICSCVWNGRKVCACTICSSACGVEALVRFVMF
jgi:hypothetical protein